MPKFDFWTSDTDSIRWHLPADPPIGSVVDFGDERGRSRVVRKSDLPPIDDADANYAVEPAGPEDGEPINDPRVGAVVTSRTS
jgi:hypothetical protein